MIRDNSMGEQNTKLLSLRGRPDADILCGRGKTESGEGANKSSAPNSVKFGTLLKLASPPGAAVLSLLRCSPPMDPLSGHIDGNYSENDKPPRNKRNLNNVPESTSRLQRDVDSDGNSRMLPVVHVISIIDVVDIDLIGPVPNRRPGFRAWIDHAEPVAAELETRRAFDHYHWDVVDAKPVSTAKMRPEAIFRNAVSVVAAAFVPRPMLTLPIVGTLALPNVLPRVA
jgi:hypothetical protein